MLLLVSSGVFQSRFPKLLYSSCALVEPSLVMKFINPSLNSPELCATVPSDKFRISSLIYHWRRSSICLYDSSSNLLHSDNSVQTSHLMAEMVALHFHDLSKYGWAISVVDKNSTACSQLLVLFLSNFNFFHFFFFLSLRLSGNLLTWIFWLYWKAKSHEFKTIAWNRIPLAENFR